jgi:Tfp pilus assembly protein PilF
VGHRRGTLRIRQFLRIPGRLATNANRWATNAFIFVGKALVALIVAAAVFAVIKASLSIGTVELRSIDVPKSLVDAGITSEVATERLRDAINAKRGRLMSRKLLANVALIGDLPTAVIPVSGISVDSLVSLIRSLLPDSWRNDISGEFTLFGTRLRLRIRLNGRVLFSGETIISEPSGDVEEEADFLMWQAAFRVMQERYFQATNGLRDTAELHVGLGYVWKDYSRLEDALDEFTKAVRIDENNSDAHAGLGFIYRAKNDINKADSEFKIALKLNPKNGDARVGRAYILLSRGEVGRAAHEFNKVIEFNPLNSDAHVGLGFIWLRQQHPDNAVADAVGEAVKEFIKAIDLSPFGADPHIGLADARLRQHRIDDAADQFAEAIRASPLYADPHISLGNIWLSQNKFSEAMEQFHIALMLDPTRKFSEICDLLLDNAKDQDAAPYLKRAKQLDLMVSGQQHCVISSPPKHWN